MSHIVVSVPARWIRRFTRPPYADSWDSCERETMSNPLEAHRVEELCAELHAAGFSRPVVLLVPPMERTLVPRIGDGVHRCLAAMRCDARIPVRLGYARREPDTDYDRYLVTPQEPLPDTEFDAMMDAVTCLSSFRSTSGVWVQSDIFSGMVTEGVHLYYPRHKNLREEFSRELHSRLLELGGFATTVSFVEEV